MAEYIEREALLKDLKNNADYKRECRYEQNIDIESLMNYLNKIPAADVVEVRHGEWEKDPIAIRDDGEIYDYRCSVCTARAHKGEYGNYDYITDYCPNCGAKMDGKGEGE